MRGALCTFFLLAAACGGVEAGDEAEALDVAAAAPGPFTLQFIGEAFNVANRYEITSINTTQYSFSGTTLFPQASFQTRSGSGTNIFGARQIQFGMRLTF